MIENNFLTLIKDPELDDDEYNNFDEKKSLLYNFYELYNHIGKRFICSSEFEDSYMLYMNDIKNININDQIEICNRLIEKIENEFEIIFSKKYVFENEFEVNSVYNFVYFIHSSFTNYIHYILEDINYKTILDGNLSNKTNLKIYISEEILYDKLMIINEKMISKKDILIKDFLLYCNNEIIYDIIISHINSNITEIVYNNLKEEI